jgi:hypothetical protein
MSMKYLGAYLMAVIGGNENPKPADIKAHRVLNPFQ